MAYPKQDKIFTVLLQDVHVSVLTLLFGGQGNMKNGYII